MALRIGCDLDGVLADMESALIREAEKVFGERLKRQHKGSGRAGPLSMLDLAPAEMSDDAPLQHDLIISL